VIIGQKPSKPSFTVTSATKDITSSEYTSNWRKGSKRDGISDVWLRLMGVMDSHEIIKNSRRDKIRFTLRLFSNMSLIKETPIQQEHSIIGPAQKAVESAAFSCRYFLIIGGDFADSMPKEEKRIR